MYPTTAEFRGKMTAAMRVRIPPPKGNGQAVAAPMKPPKPPVDDDLNDETPVKSSLTDDLNDEIDF